MIVGVLTVDLAIFEAQSLKDKRRVIQGLKQKLRNRFNVSVAEVEYANAAKRSRLGIVMVTGESRPLHSQLDKIVEMVRRTNGLTLVDYSREWI
ncbi:MAG: DUF503 domain-containing protein [Planctomycetes bacterium]|nr:DUF503 domain-containing protein [Planctomycetota bacterium]